MGDAPGDRLQLGIPMDEVSDGVARDTAPASSGSATGHAREEAAPPFDSATPHRLRNVGEEPVTAVWCTIGRRGVAPAIADGAPERPSK